MRKYLYIVFVLFLFLPVLNEVTGLVKIKKLSGFVAEDNQDTVSLSLKNFFSGEWQEDISENLSKKTNACPAFIRFRNFFDYELFDEVHVESVFKGKNNYLFYGHNDYMMGKSRKPDSVMLENVRKFKAVQDFMKKRGKQVLYVIAPDKMFVYPEFLPEKYPLTDKMRFSYDNYVKLFEEYEMEYLDFNQWYLNLKGKNENVLFAKGGKHWTYYYATIAADSIGDYLRSKNCKVADFEYIELDSSGGTWGEDVDTWRSANLPFSYEEGEIPSATYKIIEEQKDDVIFLADSYFYVIAWSEIFKDQYGANSEFWYYNKERNDVNNVGLGEASKKVFQEKNVQAYIILISVGNISSFDFGFVDYFDEM